MSVGPEEVCCNLDEWQNLVQEPENRDRTFWLATGYSTAELPPSGKVLDSGTIAPLPELANVACKEPHRGQKRRK